MARIRTVKPAFFRSHELYLAETAANKNRTGKYLGIRLAFAGLLTAADREGRFKWVPEELKLDCLPYDNVDFNEVLAALETGKSPFVVRYEHKDGLYGWIPGFKDHQRPHPAEAQSCLPEPPKEIQLKCDRSSIEVQSTLGKEGVSGKERKEVEPKPARFTPPTAQEATEYAKSIGFALDGARFVDYYASKGWKIGNSPMKDWRAAVRTWKAKDGGASAIVAGKPKPPQCSECWGLSNIRKRKRADGTEWIVCLDCFTTFEERKAEKGGSLKPMNPSEVLGGK